jgi:hypothetical protein
MYILITQNKNYISENYDDIINTVKTWVNQGIPIELMSLYNGIQEPIPYIPPEPISGNFYAKEFIINKGIYKSGSLSDLKEINKKELVIQSPLDVQFEFEIPKVNQPFSVIFSMRQSVTGSIYIYLLNNTTNLLDKIDYFYAGRAIKTGNIKVDNLFNYISDDNILKLKITGHVTSVLYIDQLKIFV